MRVLALGGVAGPALFTLVVLVCAALRPNYSHSMQVMSALGELNGLSFSAPPSGSDRADFTESPLPEPEIPSYAAYPSTKSGCERPLQVEQPGGRW